MKIVPDIFSFFKTNAMAATTTSIHRIGAFHTHKYLRTSLKKHHLHVLASSNSNPNESNQKKYSISMLTAGLLATASFGYSSHKHHSSIKAQKEIRDPHPEWQAGNLENNSEKKLASFSRADVMKHNTPNSLWVTYRHGVYDLTQFLESHPGGDALLLATNSTHDLKDWWQQLGYHNVRDVHILLEKYRIGNIEEADYLECEVKDAEIDPILRKDRGHLNESAFSYEPFIAETPISILDKHFYTPSKFHYVRNHYPVPMHLDWDSTFTISGIGIPNNQSSDDDDEEDEEGEGGYTLAYKDILSLPIVEQDIYLQCGGHRRIEYNAYGITKGSKWNIGAIGNGKYKGVLLRDLLIHIGVDVDALYNNGNNDYHVWFEGADCGPSGEAYGISIPLYKALDPNGAVMLAFEHNGEELSRDHGYPVRMLVPGWVGARSVKWIENIKISEKQCDSVAYLKSYRMTKGFKQEMRALPVNSSIHYPLDGDAIEMKEDVLIIKGEAHSGDGNPIIRVDVSINGGKTWMEAEILGEQQLHKKKWSWTKWECAVNRDDLKKEMTENVNENGSSLQIVCRAMDLSHNRQPDSCEPDLTFNPKGYGANPYHKVNVNVSFD